MHVKAYSQFVNMDVNKNDYKSTIDSNDGNVPTTGILGVSETAGITEPVPIPTGHFNDATDVTISTVMHPRDLDDNIKSNVNAYSELDIKTFLARPYCIYADAEFIASDTSTSYPVIDPMSYLNQTNYFRYKLIGFMSIRATTVLRLVVNGNEFMQGRYILAWIPSGGTTELTTTNQWTNMHRYDLTSITQLPHVEIDIGRQTEAVLKIPYVSCLSSFPLFGGNLQSGSPGKVILVPYVPFACTAGPTSCPFNLFVSYEDVELGAPMLPQMADTGTKPGKKVIKGATAQEQQSQGVGPLTSALRGVGLIAGSLKRVPMLSQMAGATQWASELAAGVASAFGFSKPLNLAPVNRIQQRTMPYMNNCDTADNSMPLSLFSRNGVEVLPGLSGTDIDETSIDYLKSIFAYYTKVEWTKDITSDTSLLTLPCGPGNYYHPYSANGLTIITQTPITFLANLFNQYRGGLLFRFKIVSTRFHTGRLMVAFQPKFPGVTPGNPSTQDSNYLFREIVDLRNGNEFCVAVPFISLQPYNPTAGSYNSFGTLNLTVLNPLNGPSTVPSSVFVLVEIAGAPDMEFAYPCRTTMQPIVPFGVQSLELDPDLLRGFEEQSAAFPPNSKCLFDHVIGGAQIKDDSDAAARICVGEKVTSLMSLAKRATVIQNLGPGLEGLVDMDPFSIPVHAGLTSTTYATSPEFCDYYGLFSSLFAMSRGGVRIRAIPRENTGDSSNGPYFMRCQVFEQLFGSPDYTGISTSLTTPFLYNRFAPQVTDDVNHVGGLEVSFPMYTQYHARASATEMYTLNSANTNVPRIHYGYAGVSNTKFQFYEDNTSEGISVYDMFRSVADDFQFGLFVSIPTTVNVDSARGITP